MIHCGPHCKFVFYDVVRTKKGQKYLIGITDIFCMWVAVSLIQTSKATAVACELVVQVLSFKDLSAKL